VKVGHDDTTLQQAIEEIVYAGDGRESGLTSLLIVDEFNREGENRQYCCREWHRP
jgi:hypothetical protein